MLSIQSGTESRNCSGTSRRDFLQVGGATLGGLTLPQLLASRALAASRKRSFVRDKSVVLVYLSGGASHIETFNPNMDAPSPYCSITGEVTTSVPGMTFGGKVTQLITVAIGLDDWEWGVTLWARNPEFLKDIVYRMRFDEASAKYAEFGPFYTSYITSPAEMLDHCQVV